MSQTKPWTHVGWHGSARLRVELLEHLDRLEATARLEPVSIGGESLQLVNPPNSELPRLALVTGWPADLLALGFELFHEGLPTDPLGIRQMIQGARAFLSIPRPGADLRPLWPSFMVTRLTEESWREQCSRSVLDLLDRAACTLLGEDDPQLPADLAEAEDELAELTRARPRPPGTEPLHYERRALRWAGVSIERQRAPGEARLLADVESFDFGADPLPVGVPYPPDYRAAERTQLANLQGLLLSMLASAKAGHCAVGCSRGGKSS